MAGKSSSGKITAALRRVAAAPASAFRRLSKTELSQLGLSPKSERFIEIGKRVSKNTTTISKRAFTVKQLGAGPEKLAEARAEGRYPYKSEKTKEAAEKQKRTHGRRREEKLRSEEQTLLTAGEIERDAREFEKWLAGPVKTKPGPNATRPDAYKISPTRKSRLPDLLRRKASGEFLPDGDWHQFIDAYRAYGGKNLGRVLRS
jgi:hypothetical protein